MIITRENLKEEASNLNDEILNLEKKYYDRTIEGFKGRTKRRRQQEKFI